jgi:hypothetical protein
MPPHIPYAHPLHFSLLPLLLQRALKLPILKLVDRSGAGFIETGDHIRPGKKGINQVFLQSASWPD